MWVYVALAVIAVAVVVGLAWAAGSRDRTDETERFHRASQLTSKWSAEGPASGLPSSAREAWPGGRLPDDGEARGGREA